MSDINSSSTVVNSQPMTFDEYERDWLKRHKGSIPRKRSVSSIREVFWIIFWLVVAAGAAVFSAAHTIPAAELTIFTSVPHRGLLAITAFVIVELVIFGASAGRREIGWLKWLLFGALLVALAGNNSSSIKAVAENGGDILNQFGGILLSTIAPLTALAAGEVLHIQLDKRTQKLDAAKASYESDYRDMEAKINTAYTKYTKDFEARTMPQISQDFTKFHETSREKQPRVKLHEVARMVHENGDDNLSASEMMEKYGISLGSTSKIRDITKNMNGNGVEQ